VLIPDVGMVAADTSRSRAYLHSMIKSKLLPSYVLVMKNRSTVLQRGQVDSGISINYLRKKIEKDTEWAAWYFDLDDDIEAILVKNNIPFSVVDTVDINDVSMRLCLQTRPESVYIYSGYGGALLRKDILATKTFLHIHGGYLPEYRGSTTNYFSLVEEGKFGASAIFLNEEIDGGKILIRELFPLPKFPELIDHFYDSAVRARVLIKLLDHYINEINKQIKKNDYNEFDTNIFEKYKY
jgi:methionyl-tRNA formyltransferase